MAENLTDGFITEPAARKLTSARTRDFERAIEHLTTVQPGCTNPSWELRAGDQKATRDSQTLTNDQPNRVWFLHDYDDPLYDNPLKAHLDKRRAQKAEAGSKGGQRSAEVRAKKYGTARPLGSAPEAEPEAPAMKQPEAPASEGASAAARSNQGSAHEADTKLARAGAHAQPLPSSPFPSSPKTRGEVQKVGDPDEADPSLLAATAVRHNGATGSLVDASDWSDWENLPTGKRQLRLTNWLHYEKHHWSSVLPKTRAHEATIAALIAGCAIAGPTLLTHLETWWDETDPDDRPTSLEFFWTRVQQLENEGLKQQQRPHVDSGPTKLSESLPDIQPQKDFKG